MRARVQGDEREKKRRKNKIKRGNDKRGEEMEMGR